MTEPRPKGERFEIVRVTDSHAPEVAEFIRAIWTPEATPESVIASRAVAAARNSAEPGLAPPTWIAVRSGKVLGYVTTIPVRLWDGSCDWPGYLIKGLMVHPDHRNGPIGFLMMKAAAAGLPRTGALAAAAPARRLFEALGYLDLGAVPNWIQPLSPRRILNQVDFANLGLATLPGWMQSALDASKRIGIAGAAGWAGGVALRAAAGALRLSAIRLQCGPFDPAPAAEELDRLWSRVRDKFPAAVVRDSRYLQDRYPVGAAPYRWVAVRDRGVLVGVAIIRQPRADGDPRLKGIRLATLADMVYLPSEPAAGLALLGSVEREARALRADAVLATASAPSMIRTLRRQWYFPLTGNVHFLFRDVGTQHHSFGRALADWWLTRGDGLSDEVF